jgi:hypothetical protein
MEPTTGSCRRSRPTESDGKQGRARRGPGFAGLPRPRQPGHPPIAALGGHRRRHRFAAGFAHRSRPHLSRATRIPRQPSEIGRCLHAADAHQQRLGFRQGTDGGPAQGLRAAIRTSLPSACNRRGPRNCVSACSDLSRRYPGTLLSADPCRGRQAARPGNPGPDHRLAGGSRQVDAQPGDRLRRQCPGHPADRDHRCPGLSRHRPQALDGHRRRIAPHHPRRSAAGCGNAPHTRDAGHPRRVR